MAGRGPRAPRPDGAYISPNTVPADPATIGAFFVEQTLQISPTHVDFAAPTIFAVPL